MGSEMCIRDRDYEAALKTLDSIPPEVIRFYENRTQEPAMRHDK